MSVEYWSRSAYGVRLDEVAGSKELIADMLAEVGMCDERGYDFAEDLTDSEEFATLFRDRVAETCLAAGIDLPRGFEIAYTGEHEHRPGKCDAPADTFVVGFWVPALPQGWVGERLPSIWPESFVARAANHQWVMCA